MARRNLTVRKTARCLVLFGAVATLSLAAFAAAAQERAGVPGLTIRPADPTEKGDGTLSAAAGAAIAHRTLPASDADVAAKAAANRASDAAEKSGAQPAFSPRELAAAGKAGPLAPVSLLNIPGLLADGLQTPPDSTGAIGPMSFVQLVNAQASIFDRTGAKINKGKLTDLTQTAGATRTFDPQVIWDGTTNRFYYVADAIFSATDNRLAYGFSKTNDPKNLTTDWCHYGILFGARVFSFPKLGDSQFFAIIGVNTFDPAGNFVGSDLVATSKPPSNITAGSKCPDKGTFKMGSQASLKDSTGKLVFTPVPANQIDNYPTGFVLARNGALPSDKLWFFNVTRDATTGKPVFGPGRGVTAGLYKMPPNASQPILAERLDTSDARNTQAVQAVDPRLGTFSFWTQHTIASRSGTESAVRWYEIDPVPAVPKVQRSGTIESPHAFLFNAAISPDRRGKGPHSAFGNNFVIEYNLSSKALKINPSIFAKSSVNGGPLAGLLVRRGAGPYRDEVLEGMPPTNQSCTADPATPNIISCSWGDYSGATPDPNPDPDEDSPNKDILKGAVWCTNQLPSLALPGKHAPPSWATRIIKLQP